MPDDDPRRKNPTIGKFGRLKVVEVVGGGRRGTKRRCRCVCDCGEPAEVTLSNLLGGGTTSCGCVRKEVARERMTTHGLTVGKGPTKALYDLWCNMISRCYDPSNERFKDWGGRGITVCTEWRDDPVRFAADVGPKPGPGYSFDRRDNDGPYAPWNVKWSTREEQQRNRRNTTLLTLGDVTASVPEWAERTGLKKTTIFGRIAAGYPVEQVLDPQTWQGQRTRKARLSHG